MTQEKGLPMMEVQFPSDEEPQDGEVDCMICSYPLDIVDEPRPGKVWTGYCEVCEEGYKVTFNSDLEGFEAWKM